MRLSEVSSTVYNLLTRSLQTLSTVKPDLEPVLSENSALQPVPPQQVEKHSISQRPSLRRSTRLKSSTVIPIQSLSDSQLRISPNPSVWVSPQGNELHPSAVNHTRLPMRRLSSHSFSSVVSGTLA